MERAARRHRHNGEARRENKSRASAEDCPQCSLKMAEDKLFRLSVMEKLFLGDTKMQLHRVYWLAREQQSLKSKPDYAGQSDTGYNSPEW